MAFIYKITNDINGKIYIGKTNFSIEKRFNEHCRDSKKERCKDRPLYRAMNKYGIEHFHIELLEETNDSESREIYWIQKYDSYHNGYNATHGGDGKQYLDHSVIIKKYQETQNAVETAQVLNVDYSYVLRVLRANQISIKSSQSIIRENTQKPILMCNKESHVPIKVFDTIREAGEYITRETSFNSSLRCAECRIIDVCKKRRKQAYGFYWEYSVIDLAY